MDKIIWSDSFSVGVPELDEHHRRLADLINSLVDQADRNLDKQLVRKAISTMTTYAFYHFGREEQLMTVRGFPFLEAHLAEHEQFCETMKEIRQNAAMGLIDLKRLTDFLTNWWTHHILEVDMKYKPFLTAPRSRGAAPVGSTIQ